MIDAETIGIRIKIAREKRGLNRRQLADKTGIKAPSISDYEQGKKGLPSLKTLEKLTNSLGVSISWLVDDWNAVDENFNYVGKGSPDKALDTTPSNNVRSTVSEQELEEGEVNANFTIEAQAETIKLLKEKISSLEAENQSLREKKRAVSGEYSSPREGHRAW